MYPEILQEITKSNAQLVCVSKTRSLDEIMVKYNLGQRVFGENRVPELVEKHAALPKDINWHMIGHLQSNKVKYIASFIDLIHSVDSIKLLKEINRQGEKHNRIINILLEVKVAQEKTKMGASVEDLMGIMDFISQNTLPYVNIQGIMGMASFVDDQKQLKSEFDKLKSIFNDLKTSFFKSKEDFTILSMGMSNDYKLALTSGSNMVRIGTKLFT